MLHVTKTIAIPSEDDNAALRLIRSDEKRCDISLSVQAVSEGIGALLTAEVIIFQDSLKLAVGDKMQPMLVIGMGGIEIPIDIPEQKLNDLYGDVSQLIVSASTKH